MTMIRMWTGLIGLSVLLHACATVAPGAPPARGTLALIDVPEPARLSVLMAGHPDAKGSLTRQIFYGQQMAAGALELTNAVQPRSFHPGAALDEALTAALPRPNRTVVHAANPQKERSELLADYSQVRTSAGQDLDVVPVAVGYWNVWPDGPYRPWVVVAWRLRDNGSGATIASGQIGSGPAPDNEPIVRVAPDDRFAFATFEALTADPARAVDGLRTTIREVAAALAQRL